MEIKYINKVPKDTEYNMLTESVGWGIRDENIVKEALENTLYSLCAYDGDKLIGYGRIIGDKTIFLYIQDIMVIPEYQGKKIGTEIMKKLLNQIDEYKKVNPNIRTYLGASKGKEDFYKKFGFVSRPNEELGAGMILKSNLSDNQTITLENIDINEFKNIVYPEYLKLFPKEERKSLEEIEKNYDKGIAKFIKIKHNDEFVGFLMLNTIRESKYIQLDYFAILPKYQSKGYGSKVIKELKNKCKDYVGIIIEVETLGLGKDYEENKIRAKRVAFYERLGFTKLNYELKWFNKVVFSLYILNNSINKESDSEILKNMFNIYYATHGKERVDTNCEIINESN